MNGRRTRAAPLFIAAGVGHVRLPAEPCVLMSTLRPAGELPIPVGEALGPALAHAGAVRKARRMLRNQPAGPPTPCSLPNPFYPQWGLAQAGEGSVEKSL